MNGTVHSECLVDRHCKKTEGTRRAKVSSAAPGAERVLRDEKGRRTEGVFLKLSEDIDQ